MLKEAYQVVKALSAGSLMLVLQEQLPLFGECRAAYGTRCISQHAFDWLKTVMTQPDGRLPLDHASIWLIEQHPTPYQASLLPDFLTHFTLLCLAEIKHHTTILARHTASSRLGVTGLYRWTSDWFYVRTQAIRLIPSAHDTMSSGSVCC